MSVHVSDSSVVIRNRAVDGAGGVKSLLDGTHATTVSGDSDITSVAFASESERNAFAARLRAQGLAIADIAEVESGNDIEWLELDRRSSEAWLRGKARGPLADVTPIERTPYQPLEHLSQSDSGLHYVRERKSGLVRLLTEDELQGFSDPPPCEECGEQFGCEHYNCAGERLLSEADLERDVPAEWLAFARDSGISRHDLDRLGAIRCVNGEYQVAAGRSSDMRTQELVLLLNDSR